MAKRNMNDSPLPIMEENIKKAVTEMLILQLFSEQERYIGTIADELRDRTAGIVSLVFPYAAIYRIQDKGYIAEAGKRIAPDKRRRQYYSITPAGLAYLNTIKEIYLRYTTGIAMLIRPSDETNG